MSAASGALKPPPPVVIDRDAFKTTLRVRAVRVPTRETDAVLRALRGFALDLPKVKAVAKDEDAGGNLVLLCDKVRDATLEGVIPEEKLRVVRGRVGGAIEVTEYEVPLSYEYFNAAQVLRKLLPSAVDVPSSFETPSRSAATDVEDRRT